MRIGVTQQDFQPAHQRKCGNAEIEAKALAIEYKITNKTADVINTYWHCKMLCTGRSP